MNEAYEAIARLLAVGEDQANLLDALEVSEYEGPDFPPLQRQVRARAVIGFWYAESKAHKRASQANDKQKWQRVEDILENALTTVNSGVIATQHTNNHTEAAIRG